MRTITSAPSAPLLIESMRDIGYSLESALADIIDNSITAGAKRIDILAESDGTTGRIGILDDGAGMSESELVEAMRLGSRDPLVDREAHDLGRFGLGLKTASLSQCRRLTVWTTTNNLPVGARWDLDHIAVTQEWSLQLLDSEPDREWLTKLGSHGTLVIWEHLDRILEKGDAVAASKDFIHRVDESREHLELVFHRFLKGEGRRIPKVKIFLNNTPLKPIDPFHSDHPSTIREPNEPEVISVFDRKLTIQAFTLPHHSKVSKLDWDRYGLKEGYLRSQGCYVYREGRLIIHGTWFGVARPTELTRLTRVRIDIPNDMDAYWKIDVKKSSAQPPIVVRNRLKRIIDQITLASKRTYTSRGRRLIDDTRVPVWSRFQNHGEIRFEINREHPLVAGLLADIEVDQQTQLHEALELIGSTLPFETLFADLSSSPELVAGSAVSDDTLEHELERNLQVLIPMRLDPIDLEFSLKRVEPFKSNWDRVELLLAREYERQQA